LIEIFGGDPVWIFISFFGFHSPFLGWEIDQSLKEIDEQQSAHKGNAGIFSN